MGCYLKDVCNKFLKDSCDCPMEDCIKYIKTSYLFSNALLSNKQRERVNIISTKDDVDLHIYQYLSNLDIIEFIKSGNNMYFYSLLSGCGKTMWSIRLIQNYLNKVWITSSLDDCKALFISVPRFLMELKNFNTKSDYVEHIKKYVLKADIVVWDEIGVKDISSYEQEFLLSFINSRLDMGKSNIYTSNVIGDELSSHLGVRLYSRIIHESKIVEFKGKDKRGLTI